VHQFEIDMNRSFLLRMIVASLLAAGAFALGQGADRDLRVPGANYVAAASHGFDVLATSGACPPTNDDSWPSAPVVPVPESKA